jgi:hypothetical protein
MGKFIQFPKLDPEISKVWREASLSGAIAGIAVSYAILVLTDFSRAGKTIVPLLVLTLSLINFFYSRGEK